MTDGRPSAHDRAIVRERARGRCEYCQCQEQFSPQPFSIEHIVPRRSGGPGTLDNLALACQGCNNHKYTRIDAIDPETGDVTPLFHPRRQQWTDHFAWDRTTTRIVGLTPIGRASVAALNLNRPGLVNLRRVLHEWGEHPPADTSIASTDPSSRGPSA
jgi:hypothetical protein